METKFNATIEQVIARMEEGIANLTRDLEAPCLHKHNTIVCDVEMLFCIGVDKDNRAECYYGYYPVRFTKESAQRIAATLKSYRKDGSQVKYMAINEGEWMRKKIASLKESVNQMKSLL